MASHRLFLNGDRWMLDGRAVRIGAPVQAQVDRWYSGVVREIALETGVLDASGAKARRVELAVHFSELIPLPSGPLALIPLQTLHEARIRMRHHRVALAAARA